LGGVAMGITALAAALWASRQGTPRGWVTVWFGRGFCSDGDRGTVGSDQSAARQFLIV